MIGQITIILTNRRNIIFESGRPSIIHYIKTKAGEPHEELILPHIGLHNKSYLCNYSSK